jgi:hypothetical protein
MLLKKAALQSGGAVKMRRQVRGGYRQARRYYHELSQNNLPRELQSPKR